MSDEDFFNQVMWQFAVEITILIEFLGRENGTLNHVILT
jgi:hypothetical protein